MIYDKPVRRLFHDMVADLALEHGQVITFEQGHAWFAEKYPKIKPGTISAHFTMLSTNAPSRIHHNIHPGDDDLFFKIDRHQFRLYDPQYDPLPIYPEKAAVRRASTASPSVSQIEVANRRIAELESVIAQLESDKAIHEQIADETLRARFSMLRKAPTDTLIREAVVVLEDRLRSQGNVDDSLYGRALVDAILDPESGTMLFSKRRGEQVGVQMLYQGAMKFIRNPPMHRLIEYHESTAYLLLRLVDALLLLLSEGEPRPETNVWTIDKFKKALLHSTSADAVKTAEDLYDWSWKVAADVRFGEGKTGTFSFYYRVDSQDINVFSVQTNGRLIINYGWLNPHVEPEQLLQFHQDLTQIHGFGHIQPDLRRYPSVLLANVFRDPQSKGDFKRIIVKFGKSLHSPN